MTDIHTYRKIYMSIIDALSESPRTREELLLAVISAFELSEAETLDRSTNGKYNTLRSRAGTVINEMLDRDMIVRDEALVYHRKTDKPIAIRIEEIEEEILELLKGAPMTKQQIKDALVSSFKTDTTSSPKDDNKLATYMGQVLKGLLKEQMLRFDGSIYEIAHSRTAEIKNRQEVVSLKGDFLTLVHSKGGEFFEHYFMNLLARYLIRCGKTVTESRTTGGSDDGGIDGIAKTTDSLGFREVIMVQMKNRLEPSVETDIRAFYGAVCARQGSRGIFATTSTFHPMAEKFLNSIDNCVGVDGDKLFAMAVDASYGIKRDGNRLSIDTEVIY